MSEQKEFDGLPRELDPFENDWPWFPPPAPNAERRDRGAHPDDQDDGNETGRSA